MTESPRPRGVETVLLAASAVVLPLGLAVILLGWFGAAHSAYLFEQVPYLISGGLLGLGLVIVGGLVYFSSILSRSAAQQQRQGEEVAELLREIRDGLRERPAGTRRAPARNGRAPYVATKKGALLHRPDCLVVAGRDDLRSVAAQDSGFSACSLCAPFDVDVPAR
ncbi:MAG: hypothetical protein WCD35_06535 [Mycobacteriales bacterium]